MARLSVWVPLLAGCTQKTQRRPLDAELGSNLRTILRTYVDFQEKTLKFSPTVIFLRRVEKKTVVVGNTGGSQKIAAAAAAAAAAARARHQSARRRPGSTAAVDGA